MTARIGAILGTIALAVVGQLMLRAGMRRVGPISWGRAAAAWTLVRDVASVWLVPGGLAIYVVSAIAWVVVLSRVELSYAYPFFGLAYVAVCVLASMLFGERLAPRQWAGVALVVVGVVLVAGS